ncbi:MAG TPA: RNA polymerase sigma factor [Polyangiaceae bacterium]|nr:RNA polymerase sigma factor [Polyangiaceae bacterium]
MTPELGPADAAMDRYAAGEASAFAIVYDEVAPRVLRFVRRQIRDAALAEEIVQETFSCMHRARGTFIPGSRVLPWAFAIARRLTIDEHRRGRRNVLRRAASVDDFEALSADAPADEVFAARQLAAELADGLSALPPAQRRSFELLRLEGLSHAEAAEVLGTSVTAVKLRAHRAYVALRARLSPKSGDGSVTEGLTHER